MRSDAWLAVLGAVAACTGSSGDGPDSTSDTSPPSCTSSIELGTGVDAFVPLSPSDELTMVFGSQGGYHLPLALHGCGVSEAVETHVLGTVRSSGAVVVDVTLTHGWLAQDECCGVLLDLKGYLYSDDPYWVPPSLEGETVDLALEVIDGEDVYEDAVDVLVHAPVYSSY